MKSNIRKIALMLLTEYELEGKYVNLSLSSHKADSLTVEERRFLTALLYTTVEHKLTYDYYISAISGRSLDELTGSVRGILRIGLCQILDMNGVADHVAVNETVALAQNKGERSFVNGVLRQALRIKDNLPLPDRSKNLVRYLSVKYSFPRELVRFFTDIYGEEECELLLKSFSTVSPTDLTVNTNKIRTSDLCDLLSQNSYAVEKCDYSDETVRINGSIDPRKLPGFDEGLFFVQDRACKLSVELLSPKENELLIDTCACPGGKSFASAIMMKDRGSIVALDLHESKLSLIESGMARLGLSSVTVGQCDATEPKPEYFDKADKVICDVPCSGLGVISKKPDLRYKDLSTLTELPTLQLQILTASAKYLKVGGRMLYSTCTLNPAENEGVVEAFLSSCPNYRAVPFTVMGETCPEGMFTFLKSRHGTDGFFVSLIERIS